MRINVIISFLIFFSLNIVYGQKERNEQLKKEALDDAKVLSSKNYPYIELFHHAVREKISGNYTEAKKLFQECLSKRKNDDAVYFGLAEIAKEENNTTLALEYFENAYRLDPNNIVYLQELAGMHADKANFEEAEVLFKEMCKREPRNIDFRYGYSRILIYNKKYELAIEQLDKLQNQTGIVPELAMMKADLYTELKKPEKAEETLLNLKQEHPDDLEVLENIIGYYEQQGNQEKALVLIEELVENDPENGVAHFILAHHYFKQNRTEDFLKLVPRIFQFKTLELADKIEVFSQLTTLKDFNDTVVINGIYQLYQLHPQNEFILLNYGNVLVAQQKTKEALSVYRSAIKSNPNNFELWANVLLFESEYMEFQALYEDAMEALVLFPTMTFVYFAAAEGALELNRPDEAAQLLASGELYLLGNKEQSALYEMRKGQIFFYNKEYKKGIIAFEKALSIHVDHNIQINYAYALAEANIALDVAEEQLAKIKNEDKSPTYYKAKAMIALQNKQLGEGIIILKNGIEHVMNKGELYDLLGDFYYQQEAIDKAVDAWKKAQDYESRNKNLSKKIKEVKYYAPEYN